MFVSKALRLGWKDLPGTNTRQIFLSKDGAYASKAGKAALLTHKHWTRLESLVSDKTSQMFGRTKPTLLKQCRLLALPLNIRIGWKGLPGTNTGQMFLSKARAFPSKAGKAPLHTHKHWTRLEGLARDKD
jgi:hypothetical protein